MAVVAVRIPGYTAEASLYERRGVYWSPETAQGERPHLLPQLGFGVGVTYPPDGDDCYCCVQWVRCPCGLAAR
jgi:hypothetical protein